MASLGEVTQAKIGCVRACPERSGGAAVYAVFQKDSSRQPCGGSGPETGEGQRKVLSTIGLQRLRSEQEWADQRKDRGTARGNTGHWSCLREETERVPKAPRETKGKRRETVWVC